MDLVFVQMPLLLFTAIAPMASGAFIGLTNAFLVTRFSNDTLRKIDQWTLLPLAILAVSFIAAIMFLVSPQSALLLVQGVDPVALVIAGAMAVVFALVAAVYEIMALSGAMPYGVRRVFGVVLSVMSIVYAVVVGVAYMMSDVPTWGSFVVPLGFAGFVLAGGVPLGSLVVVLADGLDETRNSRFASTAFIATVVGVIVAALSMVVQLLNAQALAKALFGTDLVQDVWVYLVVSIIGFIVAAVCVRGGLFDMRTKDPMGRTAGAAAAIPQRDMVEESDENENVGSSIPALVLGNVAVLVALVSARILFYVLQF